MRAILLSICFFVPVLTYLVTGLAKLAIVFDADPFLSVPNPVFSFLSNHTVIAVAAGLEVCAVIAAACLRRHRLRHSFIVLLWMALGLASYRAVLDLTAVNSSCRCLGVLETMLHPGGGMTMFLWTWLALLVLLSATGTFLTRTPVTSTDQSGESRLPRSAMQVMVAAFMTCSAKQSHSAGPPGDGSPEAGNGFIAQGHLEVIWYGPTNTISHTQRYVFETAVSLDHWRISVTWTNGVVQHAHGNHSMVFEWFDEPTTKTPSLPATISPSSYPLGGYPRSVIWLAFASAQFVAQHQLLPHPTIPAFHSPHAFMYVADVVVSEHAPGLPASIIFRVDASQRRTAARNPLLSIEGVQRKELVSRRQSLAALPDGAEHAKYAVGDWISLGAMSIPRVAELELFRDDPANRLVSRFQIRVESTESTSEPLTWPAGTTLWSISDRRFRSERQGIGSILYQTNVVPVSAQDERLQRLFTERKARAPFLRMDAIVEPVMWIAFGVLLLAPLWLFKSIFASKRCARQQQNTTQNGKQKV